MGWLGTGPVAMGWCLLPVHLQMVTEPGLFGSSAQAPGLPAGSGLLRCAGLFPGSACASLEAQAGFFSGVLRGTALHDSFLAGPSPSKGSGLLGSISYLYQLYGARAVLRRQRPASKESRLSHSRTLTA